jgi:hypothetical protein
MYPQNHETNAPDHEAELARKFLFANSLATALVV